MHGIVVTVYRSQRPPRNMDAIISFLSKEFRIWWIQESSNFYSNCVCTSRPNEFVLEILAPFLVCFFAIGSVVVLLCSFGILVWFPLQLKGRRQILRYLANLPPERKATAFKRLCNRHAVSLKFDEDMDKEEVYRDLESGAEFSEEKSIEEVYVQGSERL